VICHHGTPVWLGTRDWVSQGSNQVGRNIAERQDIRSIAVQLCHSLLVERDLVEEIISMVSVLDGRSRGEEAARKDGGPVFQTVRFWSRSVVMLHYVSDCQMSLDLHDRT
jgi:hypothetical protein